MKKVEIIYEDNHLLVVNKPVNIAVQEDSSKDKDLLTMLKEYLKEKYNKPGNVYLGLVHRLDRPVGGVMVFAKTSKCASRLSDQIRIGIFNKVYNCVVENDIEDSGILQDKLLKDNKTNYVTVDDRGKLSKLRFKKLKTVDNLSLLEITLFTGRSHQIRVQLSHKGNPIYGDQKYNKNAKEGIQIALYSRTLEFTHPITKKRMSFTVDLPNRYPFSLFKE